MNAWRLQPEGAVLVPRMRHITGLCALVLLVAYFGVWRGYETASLHFGPAWGMAVGALLLAGLVVIAVAGYIVIRAMRGSECAAGQGAERAGNRPENQCP